MRGARRVIAFCLLTAVLPTILLIIPLYLRHNVFADVTYVVAESDVLEIADGISTVFCQEHGLKMNSSFHAFQEHGLPQLSGTRKHVRLKMNMSLPDDTLEYWGFHLLKGSTVNLTLCSRYEGARLLIVEGERNLRACGLMEHSEKPISAHMSNGQGQVRVTFNTQPNGLHTTDTTPKERCLGGATAITARSMRPTVSNAIVRHLGGSVTPTEPPMHALPSTVNVDREVPNKEYEGGDSFDIGDEEHLKYLQTFSELYLQKHSLPKNVSEEDPNADTSSTTAINLLQTTKSRKHRHAISRLRKQKAHKKRASKLSSLKDIELTADRRKKLEKYLNSNENSFIRQKRSNLKEGHVLDARVGHGHAGNVSEDKTDESSVSSFENNLLTCYDGQILLIHRFPPLETCTAEQVLELDDERNLKMTHTVESDGFYYYIFYSDNDLVVNDMHAVFNLFKPTYQYSNLTMQCINQTECIFPISFWSDDTVIVEIPTRNNFEREGVNVTFLVSSCYPRMSVYIIFPVSVLFMILACAFL